MLALHVVGLVMSLVWVHVLLHHDATQILHLAHEQLTNIVVKLKMILMVVRALGLWVLILVVALAIMSLVMLIHLVILIILVIVAHLVMVVVMELTVLLNHNAHTILVLVLALVLILHLVLVITQHYLVCEIITQALVQVIMAQHVKVLLLVEDM